jgi:hypothetical protein
MIFGACGVFGNYLFQKRPVQQALKPSFPAYSNEKQAARQAGQGYDNRGTAFNGSQFFKLSFGFSSSHFPMVAAAG